MPMREASPSAANPRALAAYQSEFAAALRQPDAPAPSAIMEIAPQRRTKRFDVYRNNMHASLSETLHARFPVVARLVGEDFFRAMGLEFIKRHPPRSPVLAAYGAEFPDFLLRFEPVSELAYLPDVAHLEWLRCVAYHAGDAEPIEIDVLGHIDARHLDLVCFQMHPAAGLVISDCPVASIWSTNTHDDDVRPIGADLGGEAAMVTRPSLEVLVTPIPPSTGRLIEQLAAGAPLGQAVETVGNSGSPLDLPQSLAVIFRSGAVTGLFVPT